MMEFFTGLFKTQEEMYAYRPTVQSEAKKLKLVERGLLVGFCARGTKLSSLQPDNEVEIERGQNQNLT